MAKQWKLYEKESMPEQSTTKRIFKNTQADQLISLIKSLVKIMLLFMKLNPF